MITFTFTVISSPNVVTAASEDETHATVDWSEVEGKMGLHFLEFLNVRLYYL